MEKLADSYQEIILINDEYFKSLIKDILSAKKSIDLEVYIFANDHIGNEVANALITAAQKGVKVRVLVDGVGTRDFSHLQTKMEAAGIKTKIYHPLFWSLFKWPIQWESIKNIFHYLTHISSRNHRKTCVIDYKIVYIGSANIVEFSQIQQEKKRWQDLTIRICGLLLDELSFAFDKAWRCVSFKSKLEHIFNSINPDPILRLNFTWRKRRSLYKSLLKKMEDSQARIYIASAYFVPRRFLLLKLTAAARRGVDVRIVIPKNPDVMGMSLLMSSFYYVLLKSGVKILHHTQDILHTKLLIIDDWFCAGSSNINYRSLYYDLEVDIVLQTPKAKKQLEDQFYDYCEHSQPVTRNDLTKKSLFERIAMKSLWFIRFVF
jgi:cardiolipin synthase